MMPGPLPDPAKQGAGRLGRSTNAIPTHDVDVLGYTFDPPEPLTQMSASARGFYDAAWHSPAAGYWLVAGVEAETVANWANLSAAIAGIYAVGDVPAPSLLGQLKALVDSLGLSPQARAKLRLVPVLSVDDDVDADPLGLGGNDRTGGAVLT
jgi:hypothetical protein